MSIISISVTNYSRLLLFVIIFLQNHLANVGYVCYLPQCPPYWLRFSDQCYFIGYNAKSAIVAQRYCKSIGANLASIHSIYENNFLAYRASTHIARPISDFDSSLLIGLVDLYANRTFYWLDGSPVDYINWAITEPNMRQYEFCTIMHTDERNDYYYNRHKSDYFFKWADTLCSQPNRAFICKREAYCSIRKYVPD